MSIIAIDFDGTLLDSRARHKIALNDILREFSINIDTSDLIQFKYNGKSNIDYLFSKGIDLPIAKNIQQHWILRIEQEEYIRNDILYNDAVPFLENIILDHQLALITARSNENLLYKQLNWLKIRCFFKHVIVVEPGNLASEQKAQALKMCQASSIIGDTEVDYNAAISAKINFTALNRGFRSKEFWQKIGIVSYDYLKV